LDDEKKDKHLAVLVAKTVIWILLKHFYCKKGMPKKLPVRLTLKVIGDLKS